VLGALDVALWALAILGLVALFGLAISAALGNLAAVVAWFVEPFKPGYSVASEHVKAG
jgi:hypothetical protein